MDLQAAEVDSRGMLWGIGNMVQLDTAHVVPNRKLDIEDRLSGLMGRQKMVHWMLR